MDDRNSERKADGFLNSDEPVCEHVIFSAKQVRTGGCASEDLSFAHDRDTQPSRFLYR